MRILSLYENESKPFVGFGAGHRTLIEVVEAELFIREQQRIVDGDHFFERLGQRLDGRIALLDELTELLFAIAICGGVGERLQDLLRVIACGGGVPR